MLRSKHHKSTQGQNGVNTSVPGADSCLPWQEAECSLLPSACPAEMGLGICVCHHLCLLKLAPSHSLQSGLPWGSSEIPTWDSVRVVSCMSYLKVLGAGTVFKG